ncbi:MAG: ABC transporter ATP-binding protein [Chloroflexi bacterium]|nr:ABC transporter ATP-binding protein [Chloroflexota bacterium]
MLEQEISKPQNVGVTLRRFGSYFRKYWLGVLATFALVILSTWAQVASPDLVGQAIDCYLYEQPGATTDTCWFSDDDGAAITARINADATIAEADKATAINNAKLAGVGSVVLMLMVLYLGSSAMTGLSFYAMAYTGQNVLRDMRKALFRQIHRLSLGYFVRHEAGDVMSRITSDTDTIQQVFSQGLLQVVSGILLMVWVAFRMLQTNLIYALVSLVVVPVMIVATLYFSNQARKAFRKARQEIGSVNADLQESIAGAREVQAFNRENETISDFRESNAANRDANVRAATFTSALNPVLEALGFVALTIVVIAGGISMLRNQPLLGVGSVISLGTMIVFMQYVQRLNQPIAQIALMWTNIQSAVAGGERIFNLLDEQAEITDKPNAVILPKIDGKVEFDHVSAEYKAGEPVLKDVTFSAEPGQMVAIVGPTGAGKTTIINLLPRFYDVSAGTVRIDGHDVRDTTLESLRSQIGIVLQDSFLFSDTVMENIRYGRVDATDEEVIAAAKMVSADTFIEKMAEGYQTVLGERGSGLSQGQRQLIAIARVALMNPRLLILDEATSSVDTRTERVIQRAFEKLLAGRTSFVIAHRLSTIRNANLLLVLKDGEIVERGTHDTLLEARGAYYDLYMSQFRYEEPVETPPSTNGVHPEPEPAK